MHRVIQWSGGIGSWASAEIVVRRYPNDAITLLFADVLIEDEDLYRFNDEASARLGIPITRVCDGRKPFELFWQQHFLGNARLAPCSKVLKQKPCRAWLKQNADPRDTVLYVGLEATEQRRIPGVVGGWKPWHVEFPLMRHPLLSKEDLLAWCRRVGLTPPRLYSSGFLHNNCAGLCVRGGHEHWRNLLRVFPDRFAWYERQEEDFRAVHGDFAILKETRNGQGRPLPLSELRRREEARGAVPVSTRRRLSGTALSRGRPLGVGATASRPAVRTSR